MNQHAIIFPGQGSQHVGMGQELYAGSTTAREVFDQADEVLGYKLTELCFEGPLEDLTRSSHAQPAIFAHSIAAYSALREQPGAPSFQAAAGLSSGEWAALHVAGVLNFEDTLLVLEARGRFMQEACDAEPGAMLSVMGLPVGELEAIADRCGVQLANLNSPEQTVLSGTREGIKQAEEAAKEAGARRALPLNVSGAFHSTLMQLAADRLEEFLQSMTFKTPDIPVVSNVTGEAHTTPERIRELMVDQVVSPVQWVKDIQWIQAQGVTSYVECGPGKVLSGLVKRIDKGATLHNIQDPSTLEKVMGDLAS